ncbi:MAG TPA: HEAT repeat domain-containing protein [Clostridia bacterium]|nr:HEAT repeat domain-containing protein [Clostridia bacterium]
MLRSSDSQWKMKLADAFERFPLLRDWYPTSEERRVRAICGFRALGAAAKPAFPKLVNLVLSSDDNSDAINALTEADQGAITLLVKGLSDADPKVRVRAAFALGCLRQASSVSIPALIIALNDPDPEVRARAAGSLGPYGPQAKPALPELARLSRDESQRISYAAKEALRLIDSASQARQ